MAANLSSQIISVCGEPLGHKWPSFWVGSSNSRWLILSSSRFFLTVTSHGCGLRRSAVLPASDTPSTRTSGASRRVTTADSHPPIWSSVQQPHVSSPPGRRCDRHSQRARTADNETDFGSRGWRDECGRTWHILAMIGEVKR